MQGFLRRRRHRRVGVRGGVRGTGLGDVADGRRLVRAAHDRPLPLYAGPGVPVGTRLSRAPGVHAVPARLAGGGPGGRRAGIRARLIAGESIPGCERSRLQPVDGVRVRSGDHLAHLRRLHRGRRNPGDRRRPAAPSPRGTRPAGAAGDRQRRPAPRVASRTGGGGARPPPRLPPVRADARLPGAARPRSRAGAGGAALRRAPAAPRLRRAGMEPGLDRRHPGPAPPGRSRAGADRAIVRPQALSEPVRGRPRPGPGRRHDGRRRRDHGDAAAEPRRRHPPAAGAAGRVGRRVLPRLSRTRRLFGGCPLARRRAHRSGDTRGPRRPVPRSLRQHRAGSGDQGRRQLHPALPSRRRGTVNRSS